jgi:WD repeat-containing protein 24
MWHVKISTYLLVNDLQIMFSIVDQGDLDDELVPIEDDGKAIIIGPEVVHMSRFAERYRLYKDDHFPTRVDVCLHNCEVAESLRFHSLAYMWRTVASMLDYAEIDGLPDPAVIPKNPMQFAIIPTIRSLLDERSDSGDVQTCVALCEVLDVLTEKETVRISGLDIKLVREWYLSYIDLLRDMCLFSHATYLIRSCKDPFVNNLNQKSTT